MNPSDTHSDTSATAVYRASTRYRLLAGGALLMTLLFVWELWRLANQQSTTDGALLGALFFFGVSLCILLWSSNAALTRVEIMRNGIVRRTLVNLVLSALPNNPLGEPVRVEFRQLVSVTENGRGRGSITLVYHPRREDGLLDVYDVHSLILPTMDTQNELVELLEKRVPA